MRKISVIGHFDWNGNNMIGAVVKARNIVEELQREGQYKVKTVDIFNWRKHKIKVILLIFKAFVSSGNIILVCSENSPILMFFFLCLKKVFRNTIHYCVVGGDFADNLSDNPKRLKAIRCIDKLYVETLDCIEKLKHLGIQSASLLVNFKLLTPIKEEELKKETVQVFRFCTFSRVIKQKGITDAIKAISHINRSFGSCICELDIFGEIDESYSKELHDLLEKNEASHYCGIIKSNDSVEVLKQYYCLLFPTKYQTEGIPGTIIDGFASGVPVICSDWCRRSQIITDSYNGLVYPFDSFDGLIERIKYAISHPDEIYLMRKNCLKSYERYIPNNAIAVLRSNLK